MDKNFINCINKNFVDMLDILYNVVKEIIIKQGGFINTSGEGDAIYSLEFNGGGDTSEYTILGVRVEDGENIEICSSYWCEEMSDEDLEDSEWIDLKTMDGYYVQTLYNIFEGIRSYIKY